MINMSATWNDKKNKTIKHSRHDRDLHFGADK